MTVAPEPVDPRGARFNQGTLTALVLVAFVANRPLLIPAVATVLLVGSALGPRYGLFLAVYTRFIGPRLGQPPDLEDPRPLRFAAVFGGLVLTASTAAFLAGSDAVGWALAVAMAVLAGLSATTKLCVGCEIYFALWGRDVTKELIEEKLSTPLPVAAPTSLPASDPPHPRRWQARWVGLCTLGRWVKIVGQTPTGEPIIRAGPEKLVLSQEGQRFWPITKCTTCLREITPVDSAHQPLVLCPDCDGFPPGE